MGNYRDMVDTMSNKFQRHYLLQITRMWALTVAPYRSDGLIYEDPTNAIQNFELAPIISAIKLTMVAHGWGVGGTVPFMVHMHKNFGFAESNVQQALVSGANGIWCAVAEEGASIGHASAILTLTNLLKPALRGKTATEADAVKSSYELFKVYNFPKMLESAKLIAKICSNGEPNQNREIYGARAEQPVFALSHSGGTWEDAVSSILPSWREALPRITSFTTGRMYASIMDQQFADGTLGYFGKEDETAVTKPFCPAALDNMYKLYLKDTKDALRPVYEDHPNDLYLF